MSVSPNICSSVILSVCSILSRRYLLNRSTILNQTWYGGVLSQGKLSGREKKLVHHRQCQGHSGGLYNQNMTISTIYFKTARQFATKLSLLVRHYKPECPAEKLHYCGQGQGYSDG